MRPKRTVDLQIRGVPRALRDSVRRRASRKGVSMSKYVIEVLADDIDRPTMAEWLEEVRRDPPTTGVSGAQLIHEARREEGLED